MEESADTIVNNHVQWNLGNLFSHITNILTPFWSWNRLIFTPCLSDSIKLVTGTIICPINRNKVKLCLQESTKTLPFLLIELPLTTTTFTKSIDSEVLRIVLDPVPDTSITKRWMTYCNGHKSGFAKRLEVNEDDKWVLDTMHMVSAGAGILLHKGSNEGGYKYLRGPFEQILGSDDSEAYHLADPSYWFGQELSVFFLSN